MRRASGVSNALQGLPSDATLAVAHNDSWLFEDNVDSTHPANLRYVIASTTQRIVSARLSIHLAPFRTYNSLSISATGAGSSHHHTTSVTTGNASNTHSLRHDGGAGTWTLDDGSSLVVQTTAFDNSGNEATHTHSVSGSSVLGVTEGATATGVTVAFDGVDATAALGGPFTTDQIELNVAPYLISTQGAWHVIAMQPSGLGRIEAHLRLGMYVS